MTIEDRIREKVQKRYGCESYKLKNDSARHSGHAGDDGSGQTHFSLEITSNEFIGMSKVNAQRQVYALLSQEFKDGLHALSLKINV